MAAPKKKLRPIWFDDEDISRIIEQFWVVQRFIVDFPESALLSSTHVYFRPYPEGSPDPHGIGNESVVFVRPRKNMNLQWAATALDYLGFDETFKKNFIKLFEERDTPYMEVDGCKFYEFPGAEGYEDEDRFAMWWGFLASALTKDLKDILTPDAASEKKWKRRRAGRPWKRVSLQGAHGTMAKITQQLFLQEFKRHYTEDALKQKIARWKRERAKEE